MAAQRKRTGLASSAARARDRWVGEVKLLAGFFLAGSSSLAVFSSMAVTESPDEVARFSLPAFGRALTLGAKAASEGVAGAGPKVTVRRFGWGWRRRR